MKLNAKSAQFLVKMANSNDVDHSIEDRRLWIGNLDARITEYQLLKLVQKHGKIEKFDLLFHRSGPQAGLPRGYAFVTYMNKEDAAKAKESLNNLKLGQKSILVTWAHSINTEEVEKPKPDIHIPALAMSKGEMKTDKITQIQAIEEKLKLMEKKKEVELKINDTVATKIPVISQFQQNKTPQTTTSSSYKSSHTYRKNDRYQKPYSKNRSRR